MVITQSCDLVKTEKRKPKPTHINVCLVRSLKAIIDRLLIDEIKPLCMSNKKILERDAMDRLKDRLSKLLNNSDQKTHFFLPKATPFTEDMVAILPLSFSFRVEHYDLMLETRTLGLKSDFQAKVGSIVGQLYGRIGTPDLSDNGWDDEKARKYIKDLLEDLNLKQVPDKSSIDYIKKHFKDSAITIEELVLEHSGLKLNNSFEPMKKELIQDIRNYLIKLFDDTNKINEMSNMNKKDLSKEIANILQSGMCQGK